MALPTTDIPGSGVGVDSVRGGIGRDIIVTHHAVAAARAVPGEIVRNDSRGGLAVMAIDGGTGAGRLGVACIGIGRTIPVLLGDIGRNRQYGGIEDLGRQVRLKGMIIVIDRVAVGTDRLLPGIGIGMSQQGIDVAITELLTDQQHMLIMTAGVIVGCIDLGIGIAVRPVLAGRGVTMTAATSRLEGRCRGVRVTGGTVAAGIVSRVAVGRLIEVIDLGIVVTGLANTSVASVAIVRPVATIGKAGHSLSTLVDRGPTDAALEHSIKTSLPVRVVTGGTIETIGRTTASGVVVIEVNIHGTSENVTAVTETIPVWRIVIVHARIEDNKPIGIPRGNADMRTVLIVA